jgi:hypothetical protein
MWRRRRGNCCGTQGAESQSSKRHWTTPKLGERRKKGEEKKKGKKVRGGKRGFYLITKK